MPGSKQELITLAGTLGVELAQGQRGTVIQWTEAIKNRQKEKKKLETMSSKKLLSKIKLGGLKVPKLVKTSKKEMYVKMLLSPKEYVPTKKKNEEQKEEGSKLQEEKQEQVSDEEQKEDAASVTDVDEVAESEIELDDSSDSDSGNTGLSLKDGDSEDEAESPDKHVHFHKRGDEASTKKVVSPRQEESQGDEASTKKVVSPRQEESHLGTGAECIKIIMESLSGKRDEEPVWEIDTTTNSENARVLRRMYETATGEKAGDELPGEIVQTLVTKLQVGEVRLPYSDPKMLKDYVKDRPGALRLLQIWKDERSSKQTEQRILTKAFKDDTGGSAVEDAARQSRLAHSVVQILCNTDKDQLLDKIATMGGLPKTLANLFAQSTTLRRSRKVRMLEQRGDEKLTELWEHLISVVARRIVGNGEVGPKVKEAAEDILAGQFNQVDVYELAKAAFSNDVSQVANLQRALESSDFKADKEIIPEDMNIVYSTNAWVQRMIQERLITVTDILYPMKDVRRMNPLMAAAASVRNLVDNGLLPKVAEQLLSICFTAFQRNVEIVMRGGTHQRVKRLFPFNEEGEQWEVDKGILEVGEQILVEKLVIQGKNVRDLAFIAGSVGIKGFEDFGLGGVNVASSSSKALGEGKLTTPDIDMPKKAVSFKKEALKSNEEETSALRKQLAEIKNQMKMMKKDWQSPDRDRKRPRESDSPTGRQDKKDSKIREHQKLKQQLEEKLDRLISDGELRKYMDSTKGQSIPKKPAEVFGKGYWTLPPSDKQAIMAANRVVLHKYYRDGDVGPQQCLYGFLFDEDDHGHVSANCGMCKRHPGTVHRRPSQEESHRVMSLARLVIEKGWTDSQSAGAGH